MKSIYPFLWFNTNAEEAVNFYLSIFSNSKILTVNRYGASGPGPAGSVMTISFELNGNQFVALNGGPHFTFTEAISFVVNCETQEEIDRYWEKLSEGGSESQCGWLKDQFGLSWQIVPANIGDLVKSPEAMAAMMKMKKIDMHVLERANQ